MAFVGSAECGNVEVQRLHRFFQETEAFWTNATESTASEATNLR